MINLKDTSWRFLFRNGAILTIPPLVISFGLWDALPVSYSAERFWTGIPNWLGFMENTFRLFALAVPGILYFENREKLQAFGWLFYCIGLVLYLLSYLLQIQFPASAWSQSAVGFTAPAWSTAFWFSGIGLVCARSWLPIPWHRSIYFICVFIFLICHTGHAWLVFSQISR
jgi:hypothetical protein